MHKSAVFEVTIVETTSTAKQGLLHTRRRSTGTQINGEERVGQRQHRQGEEREGETDGVGR